MKKNNYIISIICILISIIIAFSFIYVNSKGDHICIGEECHSCVQLNACKVLLRNMVISAIFIVMFVHVHISLNKIKTNSSLVNKSTPISLKVKLTN